VSAENHLAATPTMGLHPVHHQRDLVDRRVHPRRMSAFGRALDGGCGGVGRLRQELNRKLIVSIESIGSIGYL